MKVVNAYWAGEFRDFFIGLGEIFDLEDACGKVGFGEIYLALSQHRYRAIYVQSVVRVGLIGGGLTPTDAASLTTSERMNLIGWQRSVELALSIVLATYEGVEPDENAPEVDPLDTYDKGAIFAAFGQAGIPPEAVRRMRFDDFVAISRALAQKAKDQASAQEPPSEDEYFDMIARYEKTQAKNGN